MCIRDRIDIEDDIAEIDDEFQIVVSGWSVYVESLNLTLRQGTVSYTHLDVYKRQYQSRIWSGRCRLAG